MRSTGLAALAAAALQLAALPATAGPSWAPATSAAIRPGARTVSAVAECTAGFVFSDAAGNVYLGQAARCTAYGPDCLSPLLPLGSRVTVGGATRPATLSYSSWHAMQAAGTNAAACAANDFALLRVDPVDLARVNPTVPRWGGPTGTGTAPRTGDQVHGYAGGVARTGVVVASGGSTRVQLVPPSSAADVGMGLLDRHGRALGLVTTAGALPGDLLVDLPGALAYAASRGLSVTLVLGTEPFQP